jgi:BMFP domain-containing protein YqiC
VRERERLIARIRQVRRAPKAVDQTAPPTDAVSERAQLHALQARISHLEALVEGLQDSVHRESSRHAKRITELEARIQPGALGRALSDDARARGL